MNREKITNICVEIYKERMRQNQLHPEWNNLYGLQVLVEEVGEVAHALNENDKENLKEELIQVAAVCVRWLENL